MLGPENVIYIVLESKLYKCTLMPIYRVINSINIHGVPKLTYDNLLAEARNIAAKHGVTDIMWPAKN